MARNRPPPSAADPEPPARPATFVEEWIPLLYDALRELAAGVLRGEGTSSTLQPTMLVHEAYLRLADRSGFPFHDRHHFLAIATKTMREVLIDHARRRRTLRRGRDWKRVTLSGLGDPRSAVDVLELDDALRSFAAEHARAAQVVELRVFGGLTVPEVSRVLGVATSTVDLDWRFARAMLDRVLRPEDGA